ncbi:MAG: hypothetical protein JSW51_14655, partial [Gemmatimonadota bacterium]
MRRVLTSLAAITALPLLVGSTSTPDLPEDKRPQQGNKARIAVTEATSNTGDCSNVMASAIGDMLSTSLVNTQKFVVLSDADAVGATGVLVTSTVTKFEPEAGGGGGLGGLRRRALNEVGVEEKTAEIEVEVKLIDGNTSRVLESKKLKAKSTNWEPDAAGGSWVEDVVLAGALGEYEGEPMEDAIRLVLVEAVDLITDEVPDDYYRYTGEEQMAGAAPGAAGGAAAEGIDPGVAEDMTLYTRYDFVPGNKVLFYDDMKDDEEGEFPYRWNLDNGV